MFSRKCMYHHRPKTFKNALESNNTLMLEHFFSQGKCVWFINVKTNKSNSCSGCSMNRMTQCGMRCRPGNPFASEDFGTHVKYVHGGDIVYGESGRMYQLVSEGTHLEAKVIGESEKKMSANEAIEEIKKELQLFLDGEFPLKEFEDRMLEDPPDYSVMRDSLLSIAKIVESVSEEEHK